MTQAIIQPEPPRPLDKIAAALHMAQGQAKGIAKSGYNPHDRYKYGTLEDFVAEAQRLLFANGLSLIVGVDQRVDMPDHITGKGDNWHRCAVSLAWVMLHSSGQQISGTYFGGEGMDRGDKATYKAITGARKYLLASLLNLATTDDPEVESAEQRGSPAQPQPRQAMPSYPAPKPGHTLEDAAKAKPAPAPTAQQAPLPKATREQVDRVTDLAFKLYGQENCAAYLTRVTTGLKVASVVDILEPSAVKWIAKLEAGVAHMEKTGEVPALKK